MERAVGVRGGRERSIMLMGCSQIIIEGCSSKILSRRAYEWLKNAAQKKNYANSYCSWNYCGYNVKNPKPEFGKYHFELKVILLAESESQITDYIT